MGGTSAPRGAAPSPGEADVRFWETAAAKASATMSSTLRLAVTGSGGGGCGGGGVCGGGTAPAAG